MLPSLLHDEDGYTPQQICIQDSLHMLGRRSILAGIGHSPAALQCHRSADIAESTRLEARAESSMLLFSSQGSLVCETGTHRSRGHHIIPLKPLTQYIVSYPVARKCASSSGDSRRLEGLLPHKILARSLQTAQEAHHKRATTFNERVRDRKRKKLQDRCFPLPLTGGDKQSSSDHTLHSATETST